MAMCLVLTKDVYCTYMFVCTFEWYTDTSENTNFVMGNNITVPLTSCLTGLDSAALLCETYQQIHLFGEIQAS